MSPNQANQAKHDADRWEDFLDTIFARAKKIKEIRIDSASMLALKQHLHTEGYHALLYRLHEEPPRLQNVPIVLDETLTSPKIIYLDNVPDPTYKMADLLDESGKLPRIKPKPVDTWLDDEV